MLTSAAIRIVLKIGVLPAAWVRLPSRRRLAATLIALSTTITLVHYRVAEGGFYGWPYSYTGQHVDDRVASRPDLVGKAIVPDVSLGAHVAPLQFAFYEGQQFPATYRHGVFIAEHGSWNRRTRSGYQVVFIPFKDGSPAGEPTTFFSGFVPDPAGKSVYGRPVGIAIEPDGSLLISDDSGKLIWRVSFELESRL